MNLIRHFCGVAYLDQELCKGTYPSILLPISDHSNIIQYFVYSLALVGCKTIWIISNDYIQDYLKETIGDYIPDPMCYKVDKSKIEDNLIPIYYVKPRDGERARMRREADYFFETKRVLDYTTKAVSKFMAPSRWIFTYCNVLYPLNELKTLKNSLLLEDNKENIIFRNNNGQYVGSTFTNEDGNFIHKMYKHDKDLTIQELLSNITCTKNTFNNCYKVDNIEEYKNALNDNDLRSFVYPKDFEKYKTWGSGLDQPFIGRDTVINIKKKTKKDKQNA